jgi:hypothetical protein
MSAAPLPLRAFDCWVAGTDFDSKTVVHEKKASKARWSYYLDVHECWPDLKYIDVRSRCVGAPQTSGAFMRTAKYRGVPFARVGMKAIVGNPEVGEWTGRIVGRNDSANFDVLFENGPHAGITLNCHPRWMMRYFADDGTELFPGGDA